MAEQLEDRSRSLLPSAAELDFRAELGKLAKELTAHYNFLSKDGYRARALLLRSSLDTSHDGFLSKGEFVRGAPELVLPGRELWMEAKFYERVGLRLEMEAKMRGEEDDSED